MRFDWLTWSNPVAVWWSFLVFVSAANIALLLALQSRFREARVAQRIGAITIEPLLLLSAAYVFGCAFRSVLPRADVQRICLFDTWLSSVLVGRSVATVAEICFAVQWAIVLREFAKVANSDTARHVANTVVPVIVVAEACSWYAVITTSYLGNVLENSLWTAAFLVIAMALLRLLVKFRGFVQFAILAAAAGAIGYVAFMATVDVPMYLARWHAATAAGHKLLGLFGGLHDVASRWVVTRDIDHWKHEIAWMSLYFSVAVWVSLILAGFGLVKHHLPRYRVHANSRLAAPSPLPPLVIEP